MKATRIYTSLVLAVVFLGLTACATTSGGGAPTITERDQILIGCGAADVAAAVVLRAVGDSDMSESQRDALSAAIADVRSVCDEPPETLDALKAEAFRAALVALKTQAALYLSKPRRGPDAAQ